MTTPSDDDLIEPPTRRVTWWSVAQFALLAFVSYVIIDAALGVDWSEVTDALESASWAIIILGFFIAQTPRFTQAATTLGSVPIRITFRPVYVMQLATSYMNIALPSNLGRLAVNVRFLQRKGLSAPAAVAAGTIDAFASTVVQAVLLGVLLILTEVGVPIEWPPVLEGSDSLKFALVLMLAVTALVFAFVRRVREGILTRIRQWWPEARAALAGIHSPRRLALLIGGCLGSELLFAASLGCFAWAFGFTMPFSELVVINISVSLLAAFIPVPGGVGVSEFGLTLGLTTAGMPAQDAIAAVLLHRIATFYLPPIWGFFALRYLSRTEQL